MGTRGLTFVILDGQHRIAQYGQWDHYPAGNGVTVLKFCQENLSTESGRGAFKSAVSQTRFLPDQEVDTLWAGIGVDTKNSGWVPAGKSDEFGKLYPSLSRNTGSDILALVLAGETRLVDSMDFINESLFCEWAYCVNLDTGKLEVYRGFQQARHYKGRYCSYVPKGEKDRSGPYYACALEAEFDLDNLPDAKEFLRQLERDPAQDEAPAVPQA